MTELVAEHGPWSLDQTGNPDGTLPDGIIPLLRQAVTGCNGFAYAGGDIEAQIRLVKWLRHHPDQAAVLCGIGGLADG